MAFSLTQLFKKDKKQPSNEALAQKPTLNDTETTKDEVQKMKKHGESGVCCGSCS